VPNWDERYRAGEHATAEPSQLLVSVAETLEPGRALDVACGAGRHAIFLAGRGWKVTAVDSSKVGIEITKQRAAELGLSVETIVADLEAGEFQIEENAFDLICDFYYLQRDLFPRLLAGVRPGGLFVAAIHMVDDAPGVKPMNPDYLLEPGELREFLRGWKIEHYHETDGHDDDPGKHTRRTAEIVARKGI
jgi:SAM-dependent methyltransferase